MDKNQELERGIIPAGTRIKLYEGSITLLEDTVVDANQEWIDKAIQDQEEWYSQPRSTSGCTEGRLGTSGKMNT